MPKPPIVPFVAGFLAGGIILGGMFAQARVAIYNSGIAGVLPSGNGTLLCVTAGNVIRPVTGTSRPTTVNIGNGQTATGVTLDCPG